MFRSHLCTGTLVLGIGLAALAPAEASEKRHLLLTVDTLVGVMDREDAVTFMGAPNRLRVIDVRSVEDFTRGHIPGAINLPYRDLADPDAHISGVLKPSAALARLLGGKGIDARSEIVLYDDEGGQRAARLFWLLDHLGHRRVSLLDGGLQAWIATGRRIDVPRKPTMADFVKGRSKHPRTRFVVNTVSRRHASADTILQRRGDPDVLVLDVRPRTAFVKAHIPGARNLPWQEVLSDELKIRPADDVRGQLASVGVQPDKEVIVYGQTGESAAHAYFVLRFLGFDRIRLYERSWAEWGIADDLPKSTDRAGDS